MIDRILHGLCAALVVGVVAYGPRAEAEDVTTAAAMFDRGVADMEAGRLDTACPEIAESLRLDPRPGTTFTLAECYAKAGKVASAVARYDDYLGLYGRMPPTDQVKYKDRADTSRRQKATLGPQVPTLTLRLPPGAPAATEVKRDDVVLGAPSLGVALPVDPGEHTITTRAPGSAVSTQKIAVALKETKDVVLIVSTAPDAGSAPVDGPKRNGNPQRIAGFALGSVGVAGLLMGAIPGGIALSKKSVIDENCNVDAKTCKNQEGLDAIDYVQTASVASTVGYVVGGVLLVGGVVVFITAPSNKSSSRVGVSVSPTGVSLRGSF